MRRFSFGGATASILGALVGMLGAAGVLAPSAGAVLVHVGRGQVAGMTPIVNVNPASILGRFARRGASNSVEAPGTLDYHGGAVMHGASPYLVFWDPSNKISSADKALYTRFFTDSAADSGLASNVYSVDRQFTDRTGFADYQQVFSPAQAITDPQPYPTSGQCTESSYPETACLFDAQLQTELSRLISADALPMGITGNAPEYFVVTPPDVNTCASDGTTCADNFYCAYHSSFADRGGTVLYAGIPTVLAVNDPKGCQYDNNSAVQAPNGSVSQTADVTIKAISHEFNETITDPVNGGGWYSTASGNEDGDQCNSYNATPDPVGGGSLNAFTPTLGGSAPAGTLFNQVMNGNPYYVQSEWSNQGLNCRMNPTPSALTAAFSAPPASAPGVAVSFDPSSSSAAAGYSSTSWTWGDGTANSFATGAPATLAHTYAAVGTYTATLTVVDTYGNLSTVAHAVVVRGVPTASFAASPAAPAAGSLVSFDGSGSGEPGGSISGYSWNFGDGSTGSGATTSHSYSAAGTYTVTLSVSDPFGGGAASTQQVTVVGVPAAVATTRGNPIAGVPFSFDGSQSHDIGSTLASYRWRFGGGGTATGVAPAHVFGRPGRFSVTLTVTDASGASASATRSVLVKAPSITRVRVKKGAKIELIKVTLSGPGLLRLGAHRSKVGRPRTVTLRVKLSQAQLKTLNRTHTLTARYRLTFSPSAGRKSGRTVVVKLTTTPA